MTILPILTQGIRQNQCLTNLRLAILASAEFVPQSFLLYHGVVVYFLKGGIF
jgi:hypothetical protein